jgi:hypothetical protein
MPITPASGLSGICGGQNHVYNPVERHPNSTINRAGYSSLGVAADKSLKLIHRHLPANQEALAFEKASSLLT